MAGMRKVFAPPPSQIRLSRPGFSPDVRRDPRVVEVECRGGLMG